MISYSATFQLDGPSSSASSMADPGQRSPDSDVNALGLTIPRQERTPIQTVWAKTAWSPLERRLGENTYYSPQEQDWHCFGPSIVFPRRCFQGTIKVHCVQASPCIGLSNLISVPPRHLSLPGLPESSDACPAHFLLPQHRIVYYTEFNPPPSPQHGPQNPSHPRCCHRQRRSHRGETRPAGRSRAGRNEGCGAA
jgi:hypothetical protein